MPSVPRNNSYASFVIDSLPSPTIYSYTRGHIPTKGPIRVIFAARHFAVKTICVIIGRSTFSYPNHNFTAEPTNFTWVTSSLFDFYVLAFIAGTYTQRKSPSNVPSAAKVSVSHVHWLSTRYCIWKNRLTSAPFAIVPLIRDRI